MNWMIRGKDRKFMFNFKVQKKKKNSSRTIYPLALIGFMSDVLLFTFVNSFGFAPEGKNGYNE